MRLAIPTLEVNKNDGFEKNDLFGRKEYGEGLLNLVVNSTGELVISINGQWGEGKTVFVKMWQGLIETEKIPCIYIDAFANDYIENAFMCIASEITKFAEENLEPEKYEDFLQKTVSIGKKFMPWSARVAIKVSTLGLLKDSDIDVLDELRKEIADGASSVVGNYIKEGLEEFAADKGEIQEYRKLLSEISMRYKPTGEIDENESIKPVSDVSRNKPLIVIIDELDRCKPTFAIEILERIKHLFSVENVVFVLVMNKLQFEESIKSVYGQGIDANTYLQKFIHVEMRIPKKNHDRSDSDIIKYSKKLASHHNITDKNIAFFLNPLAIYYNLSLRELERVYTSLTIYYATNSRQREIEPEIIVFLAVTKVINSTLLQELELLKVTSDDPRVIFDVEEQYDRELKILESTLKILFMPEAMYEMNLKSDTRIYERFGFFGDKQMIIPDTVRRLNMFQ